MWNPLNISSAPFSPLFFLPQLVTLAGLVTIIWLLLRHARAQESAAAQLEDIADSLRVIAVSVAQSQSTDDSSPDA